MLPWPTTKGAACEVCDDDQDHGAAWVREVVPRRAAILVKERHQFVPLRTSGSNPKFRGNVHRT
jgi:hypothetical protein